MSGVCPTARIVMAAIAYFRVLSIKRRQHRVDIGAHHSYRRTMELRMPHLCYQLPPNTKQPPPPSASSAGAWARSSHFAGVLLAQPCPRRARALKVAAPNSRPLDEAICTKNISHGTKLRFSLPYVYVCMYPWSTRYRADKIFQVEMTVRDCELDQHGVVHNAAYATYIGKAREGLAASLGISRDSIARTGKAMALSELDLKYFTPLMRGARFVVMVRVVQIKGVRMLVEHFIETLPERKLVLEATATVVFLNKDYRPTRVFSEVSSKLLHFSS
ncbi:acyl-acyl carrier protein thioesterase TE1, chloroplastic-like [Phragmites australis]|uniref:acyl-acyl carrier protein thioesterase TE1, chloroplastic-like n=1 Tax=Phragmites australis TaxID=29695 RepID=UPI002D79B6ED|nr:acyl-acyl carrier protein thioesterase TE1, chloroplastic-like [Phragmites australis]